MFLHLFYKPESYLYAKSRGNCSKHEKSLTALKLVFFKFWSKACIFFLFFASILAPMADLQISRKDSSNICKNEEKNELITPLPPWRSKCKAREGALGSLLHVWPNESTFYRKIAAF